PVVAEFFKLKPQSDEQPLDLPTGCNVARDLHIISRDDEGGNLVSGYEVFNRSLVLSERVAQIRWRGRPGALPQEHTVFRFQPLKQMRHLSLTLGHLLAIAACRENGAARAFLLLNVRLRAVPAQILDQLQEPRASACLATNLAPGATFRMLGVAREQFS